MSSQFGLDTTILGKIAAVFAEHAKIEQVILYGSRATDKFRAGSDIDLTLKGNALTLALLNRIEREIDDLNLPYQIDLSIYHHIDNAELLRHIDRVGKIISI